jgi:hypothetical protein
MANSIFMKNYEFSWTYNGIEIDIQITYGPKVYTVKMIKPFNAHVGSSSINFLSPMKFAIIESNILRAKTINLLPIAKTLCASWFDHHEEHINVERMAIALLKKVEHELNTDLIEQEIDRLYRERHNLRQLFKEILIDQNEYQLKLKVIKQSIKEQQQLIQEKAQCYVGKSFTQNIPDSGFIIDPNSGFINDPRIWFYCGCQNHKKFIEDYVVSSIAMRRIYGSRTT